MRRKFQNRVKISVCPIAKHTMGAFLSRILGMIICSLSVVPMSAGDVLAISILLENSVINSVQKSPALADIGKRRDPFTPIKKPRSIPSAPKKSKPRSPKISPISTLKYPSWTLLGIIHGQHGHLAVIQTLSGERIFVEPGPQPVRDGWIIKTISDTEVHLVHASSASTGKRVSRPKTFILSFSTVGKSS